MKTERLIVAAIIGGSIGWGAAPAFAQADPHAVKVSVGYADTLRSPAFTPTPWQGTPGVIFIGSGPPWDAGAIMLNNPSANALTVDDSQSRSRRPIRHRRHLGPLPDHNTREGYRGLDSDYAI